MGWPRTIFRIYINDTVVSISTFHATSLFKGYRKRAVTNDYIRLTNIVLKHRIIIPLPPSPLPQSTPPPPKKKCPQCKMYQALTSFNMISSEVYLHYIHYWRSCYCLSYKLFVHCYEARPSLQLVDLSLQTSQ